MSADHASLSGKDLDRIAHNINPGEWKVGGELPIATLLGSCVAVCLFDTKLKLAGMNHFLLPSRIGRSRDETDIALAGDYAMEVLLNAMLSRGAQKKRLVAKAFGGGYIMTSIRLDIGARNSAFAVEWLGAEGIPLLASDFSGCWSRKVVAVPQTGEAFCRRLPIDQPEAKSMIEVEAAYEKTFGKRKATNVELF